MKIFLLRIVPLFTLCACTFVGTGDGSSSSSSVSVSSSSVSSAVATDVQLIEPVVNDVVASPLTITGMARGTWFFEASFPVTLLDGNGKVLVQSHVDALSDWMTTDFVPFKAELAFPSPMTPNGTLVLKKDNPSGLPEHDAEVRIPVRFK